MVRQLYKVIRKLVSRPGLVCDRLPHQILQGSRNIIFPDQLHLDQVEIRRIHLVEIQKLLPNVNDFSKKLLKGLLTCNWW